jgi:hypothetical protein
VLFAAAAGGGFAATRMLAGRPVLPPPVAPTTTSAPPAQPVTSFVTVTAQAPVLNSTQADGFTLSVPAGWTKFVEQRDAQATQNSSLPDSTVVRWVKPDGTAEVSVERFHDENSPPVPLSYTNALSDNDKAGALFQAGPLLRLFRTGGDTLRSMYITFTAPAGGTDLWVLSVTVPTDQEHAGGFDLFNKISPSFHVIG